MGKVSNFSEFYYFLKLLPYEGDIDDLKESLVYSVTQGRTQSLREVGSKEYKILLDKVKERVDKDPTISKYIVELKFWRSSVLSLLTKIGVDTQDWNAVDSYLMSPRIAGKPFRHLSVPELTHLSRKKLFCEKVIGKMLDRVD